MQPISKLMSVEEPHTDQRISAVIIAGEEEHNIADCLETLTWTDEIIVLCSSKSDRTMEIAGNYTPHVHFKEFAGYSEQRKAALSYATMPWVLSIDADERITPESKSEIQESVSAGGGYAGFRIPRKNFVHGQWLRFGKNYPDYQLRLFRREKARVSERLIHEGYIIEGEIGDLQHPMLHYTMPSVRHMLTKNLEYARLEAEEKRGRGTPSLLDFLMRPPLEFLKKYFILQGFRDGWFGLVFAVIHAIGKTQVLLYRWEMNREDGTHNG